MKRLRDVNVRPFQTLAFQRHVDDCVKADIGQIPKLFQHRTLDSNGFFLEPVQRDKGRIIRRFGEYLIRCNPRPIKADIGQRSERLNHQRATTFYDFSIVQSSTPMVMIAVELYEGPRSRKFATTQAIPTSVKREFSDWFADRYVGRV